MKHKFLRDANSIHMSLDIRDRDNLGNCHLQQPLGFRLLLYLWSYVFAHL